MKKSTIFYLLTAIVSLILITPTRSDATNMRAGAFISPSTVIALNNPVIIAYLLRNDSLYDAEAVKSIFTVRDATTNEIVYQNETITPFIAAYTAFVVSSQLAWNPQYAGRFRLSVDIVYNQDVIPGDNSRSTEIRVVLPPAGVFQAYRFNMLLPYYQLHSTFGEFALRVPPRQQLQWLNVVGWKGDTEAVWLGKNLPLPPKTDSLEYSTYINWNEMGLEDGVQKDSVTLSVTVTDTTWNTLETELLKQGFILKLDTHAVDDGAPAPPLTPPIASPTPQNYAKGPTLRDYVLRDSMPNIDLDSSRFNPGTVTGYAGDLNACVPASGANSMEWLEREEEALPHSVDHGVKLGLLSTFCKRANETGVRDTAFVKAKLHFVDSMKLPIRVKWQSYFTPASVTSLPSPITRFGHSASNQSGGGATPKVTMDWIVQEVEDEEDVEIFYAWQDTATKQWKGSHAVTVSGIITDNDRLKGMWFVDDGNQSFAGGTRQRYFDIDETADPRGPVVRNFRAGHHCFIHGAFSESYDSTIKFEEQQGSVSRGERVLPRLHVSVSGSTLLIASLPERTKPAELRLIDVAGRVMYSTVTESDRRLVVIDLGSLSLPRGSYFINLSGSGNMLATGSFVY